LARNRLKKQNHSSERAVLFRPLQANFPGNSGIRIV
jgi:hypothetical protein